MNNHIVEGLNQCEVDDILLKLSLMCITFKTEILQI